MWYTVLAFSFLCISMYILKQFRDTGPNKIKFYLNYFIYYFSGSLLAAVIWTYFLFNPKDNRNAKVASRIMKHVTKIYDLKWHLRDGQYLSEDRGAVVVSNHQSSLDVLGMFNIWEVADKITAITKKELFYFWPFGLAAYLAGVVFIDRNNTKEAYKQLQITSDIMVKKKTKIWIFPEGTRNKDYTKLLPFKKGAFNIAVAAQVPIIPVVFSPYYFINREKYIFNKGHVVIQCLEPIPTAGLTMEEVPDLIQKVHDQMTAAYNKLLKEVLTDLQPDYPFPLTG